MERTVSSLIRSYINTKEGRYFKELLDMFRPLITSYARKLYYLEYEDSVQELSIALYEALLTMKDFSNEYACISYIKRSVINRFTKLYRKSKESQQLQSICTTIDENWDLEANVPQADDCIFKIDLEIFLKGKSCLEQTIIFLLFQGYSDKEIGTITGYTPQYINRLKKRILS